MLRNRGRLRQAGLAAAVSWAVIAAATAPARANEALNDYPTVARADYVFACMVSNGQTRIMLERCACSIDHIATILPYEAYVRAETMLSVLQVGGERVGAMRGSQRHGLMVADLRRAQAEADILCF